MIFDVLDTRMRHFETQNDHFVAPDFWIVVRLDGRNFTKLTKEQLDLERPFDSRIHHAMLETTRHLMSCGFRALYGYTQSDEISLLLHPNDQTFSRKERKLLSVLAGEASAKLSLELGVITSFGSRLCVLPNLETIVDYFRWRAEDAHRNALNAHCYWTLRSEDHEASVAAKQLEQFSTESKIAFLRDRGTIFHNLPRWQLRGSGLHWTTHVTTGFNPQTQEKTFVSRRRLENNDQLPENENYSAFIRNLCEPLQ